MNGRVHTNLGRERHSIGPVRDNLGNDAFAFDVELLGRDRTNGGPDAVIEIQPVGRDVRPVPDHEQGDDHLADQERHEDHPSRHPLREHQPMMARLRKEECSDSNRCSNWKRTDPNRWISNRKVKLVCIRPPESNALLKRRNAQ